jgi:[glutamine synthetase] adenylyltransferase / [glutamine synthetase]-adenylyl-L-tyrosine phosphorylase
MQFDIKQGPGGSGDFEFLTQYWALLWAKDHPPVAMYADTICQLESVASADLVPQATVDILTRAYRAYRTRAHHLSLENREPFVHVAQFAAERAVVGGGASGPSQLQNLPLSIVLRLLRILDRLPQHFRDKD